MDELRDYRVDRASVDGRKYESKEVKKGRNGIRIGGSEKANERDERE